MLQLRSLGALRLMGPTGELLPGRRKELVLLVYLARRGPRAVRREELATLLWGDSTDARARHSLRQALSDLKHTLGDSLRIERRTVALAPESVGLDVTVLEDELASDQLEAAVQRWKGEFLHDAEELGGEEYRAWVRSERQTVRREVSWALERLAADAERRADWPAAVRWAQRRTELQPLDEGAQSRLIEALQRGGRTAEALAQHARFLAALRDVSRPPSAEFLRLAAAIERRGRIDAALAPAPGSAALFTPNLVGRDAELGELHAAWNMVREGRPAVILLEGDDGFGKTRLVETFLRAAQGNDLMVLRGGGNRLARPGESSSFASALLAPLRNARGLGGASEEDLSNLSQLVPAVRERFPHLPPAQGDPVAVEQAVVQVLDTVANEIPVVLFVDDLDDLKADAVRLVISIARQLPSAPILLLACARDPSSPAVVALRSLPGARRIRLRPLSVEDVTELIGSMLACPDTQRQELAERLHSEGGGNPMFVGEMVAALVDEGRFAPDAKGYWRLTGASSTPLPIPATVREVLRERVATLNDDERALLEVAGALPHVFGSEQLGETSGFAPERVRTALDRLIAARLLREEVGGGYAVTHALLRRVAREMSGARVAALPASAVEQPPPDAAGARRRRIHSHPLVWATGALVLLITASVGVFGFGTSRRALSAPVPVLAVGLVRDYAGTDTATYTRALPEMLATSLARVPGLQLVSQARMYEILEQLGRPAPSATALAGAARRAGAGELLEGELYHPPGRPLRLELRHVDLQSGRLRAAYTLEAADVFGLVDSATRRIARSFAGGGADLPSIADAGTSSAVAYRMYEEGLRSHSSGELPTARRFFRAALNEDPGFGLAAYYLWLTEWWLGGPGDSVLEQRILTLSAHTPERERLLLRGLWASVSADPMLAAVADSLLARYPTEPDGHLLLARARIMSGDFLSAVSLLRRVVDIDSLSLSGRTAHCRACDAFALQISAYSLADSLPAAERVAREWVSRQPGSGRAWGELAGTLEAQGNGQEALIIHLRGAELRAGHAADAVYPAVLAIRAGDFEAADRLLREQANTGTPAVRRQALWLSSISLRTQGRLHEALSVARALRHFPLDSAAVDGGGRLAEAQVLFELGRYREAAALFDSASIPPPNIARRRGTAAGWRSWRLTHAATALAYAGDTAGVARLADSIERIALVSGYARDQRLHHYVRGLLWSARGQPQQAVTEFQRALYSLPFGYSRNNLELARLLLTLGRSDEAVGLLQAALRGWIGVGGFYATHTELREQLGHAFAAAGHPDSAAAHYQAVVHAWRAADPELLVRRDTIRLRLQSTGPKRGSRARPGQGQHSMQ